MSVTYFTDLSSAGSHISFGAVLPNADGFLTHIEMAEFVIRNTAFDCGSNLEFTNLSCINLAAAVIDQLPLLDIAALAGGKVIKFSALRAAIHTRAINLQFVFDLTRSSLLEHPRLR